jgi:hypothetical protein
MGVDALFLRFYQTAQRRAAAGHDDAMLRWWNGTTCSRRHLRPDGYGLYQYEGEPHGFFLEYDRGTMRRHGYRDKLDEYYDYHISGRYQRDYSAYPTILIVTVNNHTEDTIAEVAEVTADRYGFRLPLLLTCTGRVDAPGNPHGLLGPIWRPPDGASIERRRWL